MLGRGGATLERVRTALTIFLLLLNYFISQYDKFVLAYFQREVIETLHLTTTQYGLLSGYATGIVSALASIPMAFVADYSQARIWTLTVAATWWNICVLLQGYTHNFWQMFLARLAMSIGQAPVEALSVSLVSDLVPTRWLFLSESILYVGVYIGEAVSAQIATAFAKTNTPWNDALKAIGIVGLVLIFCLRLIAREPERQNLVKKAFESASLSHDSTIVYDNSSTQRSRSSAITLLRDSCKYIMRMRSFWILALSSGARQFSGNVFGTYMPSYLSSTYDSAPDLLSHYGIIVGVVGSVAVLLGGVVCSAVTERPATALYITAIGGMISGPFVVCMVFSLQLGGGRPPQGQRILYGAMSAAYLTAELWLGAFASLLASLLPPRMKTFGFAIYSCTIILIYSSAPQIIGLALRSYNTQSAAYITATRNILAILIPVGYWVGGVGFLIGAINLKGDLAIRRQMTEMGIDSPSGPLSKIRFTAFVLFVSLMASLTIALLVTSLVVN